MGGQTPEDKPYLLKSSQTGCFSLSQFSKVQQLSNNFFQKVGKNLTADRYGNDVFVEKLWLFRQFSGDKS